METVVAPHREHASRGLSFLIPVQVIINSDRLIHSTHVVSGIQLHHISEIEK